MASAPSEIQTPPPAPISDDEDTAADLPLTMAASVVLTSLPRDAAKALEGAGELKQDKGIYFVPITYSSLDLPVWCPHPLMASLYFSTRPPNSPRSGVHNFTSTCFPFCIFPNKLFLSFSRFCCLFRLLRPLSLRLAQPAPVGGGAISLISVCRSDGALPARGFGAAPAAARLQGVIGAALRDGGAVPAAEVGGPR